MKYKVMIVEDQTMPRELFELRVQSSEHFEVALSIDNAALTDVYCLRFPVDLILMDVVTRGGESGLDAAERIKRAFPQIKIIIVTSMPECSYLSRAREIGVESFWYKEEQRESLLDVMERTMAGESVYPDATPELQLGLASSYAFTDRELEVLREMTGGDTNQEIAERLHMSVATVKTHILNMLEKTGFKNRTELAVRARESGLVILNKTEYHSERAASGRLFCFLGVRKIAVWLMRGAFLLGTLKYRRGKCHERDCGQHAKHAAVGGGRMVACGNGRIPRGSGSARKDRRYLLTLPGRAGGYSADGGQPSAGLHVGKPTEADRMRAQGDAELQIRAAV